MSNKFYVLTKLSSKGWQFSSHRIEAIHDKLEQHVCSGCLMTKKQWHEKVVRDSKGDYIEALKLLRFDKYSDFMPYEFPEMSHMGRIEWMLSSACGCEFMFEEFSSYKEFIKDLIKESQ